MTTVSYYLLKVSYSTLSVFLKVLVVLLRISGLDFVAVFLPNMRMLPFFELGGLKLPSFGVMMVIGFVVAGVWLERQYRKAGLGKNLGWDTVLVALAAGIAGARVNFLLEHPDLLAQAPSRVIFGGGGLTWFGGFILGTGGVLVLWRIRRVPVRRALDIVAPALALGYAVGRIGCQLSGDGDYGKPSGLPWAMSYPNGTVPTLERVHPTPVYETLLMLGLFFLLWWLGQSKALLPSKKSSAAGGKRRAMSGLVFWVYLVAFGIERFLIEFLRTNKAIAFGLTEVQFVSIVMTVVGAYMLITDQRRAQSLIASSGLTAN